MTKSDVREDQATPFQFLEWREMALGKSQFYRPEFLLTARWGAVPVETGMHFDESDIRLLSIAASAVNEQRMFAVPLEPYKGIPECSIFPTSEAGLDEFQDKYGSFDFLLVGEKRGFSVICTSDFYFVLAGPTRFLEAAIGMSVSSAIEKFRSYSQDESCTAHEKALGLKLIRWCESAVAVEDESER